MACLPDARKAGEGALHRSDRGLPRTRASRAQWPRSEIGTLTAVIFTLASLPTLGGKVGGEPDDATPIDY